VDHLSDVSRSRVGKGRIAGSWLAALALLGAANGGHAQTVVTPASMNRTLLRENARAGGMGGTYLIIIDDASGAAFNPASIGEAGRYSFSGQAGARTEDIPVSKIQSLKNALDDLRDQISAGGPGQVTAVRTAFNRLYRDAVNAGAQVNGPRAARLAAEADPLVGLSYRNVGLLTYGGLSAVAGLGIGTGTGPDADKRTLTVSAGALAVEVIEIPYAFRLGPGKLGLGFKTIRSSYGGYAMSADASNDTIVGAHIRKEDSRRYDVDLGYTSDSIPIKGLPGPGIRAAGVIRNLFSPDFSIPVEVQQVTGPPISVPSEANFRFNPQLDVGALAPYSRLLVAMEIHNLSGTNGGDATFHFGGEYRVWKYASLRLGYDADRFVGGVGFNVGPVRLDVASSDKLYKRVAVGLSVRVQ
jgi:hypothetical protein